MRRALLCLPILAGLVAGFDHSAVVTIKGQITAVKEVKLDPASRKMVVIEIVTKEGPYTVELGPKSYLEYTDFVLKEGDRVSISGPMTQREGKAILEAHSITKRNETLLLRDKGGEPMWILLERVRAAS